MKNLQLFGSEISTVGFTFGVVSELCEPKRSLWNSGNYRTKNFVINILLLAFPGSFNHVG